MPYQALLAAVVAVSSVVGAAPSASAAPSVTGSANALADLFPGGRHGAWRESPGDPLTMVRAFIADTHDPTARRHYRYVQDAAAIDCDRAIAGTLTSSGARQALIDELSGPEDGGRLAAALGLVAAITASGGRYGFDGQWQNACAAPTPFLLVLDRGTGEVSGIDLEPCAE